jgi:hypothetical protein
MLSLNDARLALALVCAFDSIGPLDGAVGGEYMRMKKVFVIAMLAAFATASTVAYAQRQGAQGQQGSNSQGSSGSQDNQGQQGSNSQGSSWLPPWLPQDNQGQQSRLVSPN